MNQLIYDTLSRINPKGNYEKILPHQFATLDYIYKKIIYDNKSVLIFHKMGSGKTIISLLLAVYLINENKNVFIVLPNNNIKNLWETIMITVNQLIPFGVFKKHKIFFNTKKELIEDISENNEQIENLKKKYLNSVFIIDEAHNLFGNTGSEKIKIFQNLFKNDEKIKQSEWPIFVLVSGSPITNTPMTLKDLVNILTYSNITENDYIIQKGNKIYNIAISKEGINLIKEKLVGQISFFSQMNDEVPKKVYIGKSLIKLPFISCYMSKEQNDNYLEIKNQITNDMFLKYLLDVSFTAMGSIKNIKNFESYLQSRKKYQLTDTLYISNGRFGGSELETLDNSCKIKYFVKNKIYSLENRVKTFIYFSNSKIGGRFLKDVLKCHGVQEYGQAPLENFMCYYCNKAKTCEKCKPLTYIIITSIYMTNLYSKDSENNANTINDLLNIFNLSNNNNGEEICFIFGSKIISESYTLKETKEIWFLTIPDSSSEMSQIIARCVRNFSYSDLSILVKIFILVAVDSNFNFETFSKKIKSSNNKLSIETNNKENIDLFINNLMDKDKKYSYDLKKILYLEIKTEQTNIINKTLRELSKFTNDPIDKVFEELFILEIIRKYLFTNLFFSLEDIINLVPKSFSTKENIIQIINKLVNDKIIIINKDLNKCTVVKKDDLFYCQTIKIKFEKTLFRIKL